MCLRFMLIVRRTGLCCLNLMRFVVRMDRGSATIGHGHDAKDVDEDRAGRFILFERKHTHIAFLEKVMKREQSPVLAV